MNVWFGVLTVVFIVLSAAMVLVILVQRPSGGGLAGAFGGAAGGGTDTVFGGRVGDALTVITVIGFVIWLLLAVSLNLVESEPVASDTTPAETEMTAPPGETPMTELPASGGPIRVETTPTPTDGAAPTGTAQPSDTDGDEQQPE